MTRYTNHEHWSGARQTASTSYSIESREDNKNKGGIEHEHSKKLAEEGGVMRKALKQLNGERRRFQGTFVRCGQKPGWKGNHLTTILLKDIRDTANGKIVSDHLWFNLTKDFSSLVLKEGVIVSFDARVKLYYKGYQGYREDVDKPVEMDFKLSHPTKVQNDVRWKGGETQ